MSFSGIEGEGKGKVKRVEGEGERVRRREGRTREEGTIFASLN